ncbi:MAG TPA: GNAT family N-acetyltransferase [Ignavibacteria bacterium]|nr:GNAT family N-acetyltransferase [Ignavibacteria bacterium]
MTKSISKLTEAAEAEAIFQMHSLPRKNEMEQFKGTVKKFGSITAARTDLIPDFFFSRVMGFTETPDRELISEIINFFEGRDGLYALQIPPMLINADLKKILAEYKFFLKNSWAKFYRETDENVNAVCDLEIREINSNEKKTFTDLVCKVFDIPAELSPLINSVIERSEWKHFMAYEKDLPIATGSIFIHGDTAWNCFAATLPEYRGKGAQGALITGRIKAARKAGCKYITSETNINNGSYRNLIRYGYRILYERPNFIFDPSV